MNWSVKPFTELSLKELYALLKLRAEVFVVEQTCIYNDLDELDFDAIHLFGMDNGDVLVYARILPAHSRFKEVSLGRIVVSTNSRGLGYGKEVIKKSIEYIKENISDNLIRISAQEYLLNYYEELGFKIASSSYLEDGIPHVEMVYSFY
jgi:ElaA protein